MRIKCNYSIIPFILVNNITNTSSTDGTFSKTYAKRMKCSQDMEYFFCQQISHHTLISANSLRIAGASGAYLVFGLINFTHNSKTSIHTPYVHIQLIAIYIKQIIDPLTARKPHHCALLSFYFGMAKSDQKDPFPQRALISYDVFAHTEIPSKHFHNRNALFFLYDAQIIAKYTLVCMRIVEVGGGGRQEGGNMCVHTCVELISQNTLSHPIKSRGKFISQRNDVFFIISHSA